MSKITTASVYGVTELDRASGKLITYSTEAMEELVRLYLAENPYRTEPYVIAPKPWHIRLRQRITSLKYRIAQRAHDLLFGESYCHGYDW